MNQQEFTTKLNTLFPRRRQVLSKILAGESNRAIAQSLHIEESTVRKHLENICETFGIKNEPGERFSKRPDLITFFSRYQPELILKLLIILHHWSCQQLKLTIICHCQNLPRH